MSSSREIRDFFMSYSSKDAEFATRLANDLHSKGVRVWWDKMEMKVGDSLHQKIQEGISNSAWLGIVLSPHSVSSPWVVKELSAALAQELERKDVFVLPILYQDCQVPVFLKDKVYADFRISYDRGLEALLDRINPPIKPKLWKGLMSGTPSKIAASFAGVEARDRKLYCDQLASKLSSSCVGERIAALTAVFVIRDKNLSGHLPRMAKDSSSSVRRFAVFYLGELRAKVFDPCGQRASLGQELRGQSGSQRCLSEDKWPKHSTILMGLRRWKVVAGIGACVLAVGLVIVAVLGGVSVPWFRLFQTIT